MKEIISLDLLSTQAENGFTLDELVVAIKEMFADKGFPSLLEFILRCVDESVTIESLSARTTTFSDFLRHAVRSARL